MKNSSGCVVFSAGDFNMYVKTIVDPGEEKGSAPFILSVVGAGAVLAGIGLLFYRKRSYWKRHAPKNYYRGQVNSSLRMTNPAWKSRKDIHGDVISKTVSNKKDLSFRSRIKGNVKEAVNVKRQHTARASKPNFSPPSKPPKRLLPPLRPPPRPEPVDEDRLSAEFKALAFAKPKNVKSVELTDFATASSTAGARKPPARKPPAVPTRPNKPSERSMSIV